MNIELLEKLKSIKASKYNFAEIDVLELSNQLLRYIGDQNSEIRDDFVYPVLAHILHDNVLEDNDLDKIANLLISKNYLFYDMENKIEYSVLTRSFTLLQLVILVYKHNEKEILSKTTFQNIIDSFYEYYARETELYGYVEEVGWCHSVAHSADLFSQLFKNNSITIEQIIKGFNLIQSKFLINHYQYISKEDERTITAIENAINRNILPEEELSIWINGFKNFEKGDVFPEAYTIELNVRNFLRSLYFRFVDNEEHKFIAKLTKDVLKEIK